MRFSLCGTILLRLDLTAKNTAAGLKEWVVNGGTLIAEAFPGYFEGAEGSAHHQPPSCWDSVHLACRKILQTINIANVIDGAGVNVCRNLRKKV